MRDRSKRIEVPRIGSEFSHLVSTKFLLHQITRLDRLKTIFNMQFIMESLPVGADQ